MNFDYKVALDIAVLGFSAFMAYSNMRVRSEIDKLKWWIVRNFQAKKDATFMDASPSD